MLINMREKIIAPVCPLLILLASTLYAKKIPAPKKLKLFSPPGTLLLLQNCCFSMDSFSWEGRILSCVKLVLCWAGSNFLPEFRRCLDLSQTQDWQRPQFSKNAVCTQESCCFVCLCTYFSLFLRNPGVLHPSSCPCGSDSDTTLWYLTFTSF